MTYNNKIIECKKKTSDVIYLDNNGTTKLCKEGKNAMISWLGECANPSTNSVISNQAAKLIEYTKKFILEHCGIYNGEYSVIITSCASESNCFILRSTSEAYYYHSNVCPHIITSAVEHKSIIDCCKDLLTKKKAEVTFLVPDSNGCIDPMLVQQAIKPNTSIITIMSANNEIGCINNIKEIGRIANSHGIPMHTDAVQTFGKYKISLPEYNIDVLTASMHKFHGPLGIGLLIINNKLIEGYGLGGQISGTQQYSLRGGTENIAAISACIPTIKHVFKNRKNKNNRLYKLKNQLISYLAKKIHKGSYYDYINNNHRHLNNEFIIIGPQYPRVLPNTILISFVKNKPLPTDSPFCNVNLKKYLATQKIIVSIGSACSTSSKHISHVVDALNLPNVVHHGIIRISLSDLTTINDIKNTAKALINGVSLQMTI